MRNPNPQTTFCQMAVSLLASQYDAETFATLDRRMIFETDLPALSEDAPYTNANEATGSLMATRKGQAGFVVDWSAKQPRAQAQHLAFLLGLVLGKGTPATVSTGVYKHVFTPADDPFSLPYASVGLRVGKNIAIHRYGAVKGNSVTLDFGADFLGVSGELLGSGLHETDIVVERQTVAEDAESVTLTYGVYGSTAQERLDSVQCILSDGGAGKGIHPIKVEPLAAGEEANAVVTFDTLTGDGDTELYIVYRTDTNVAWAALPALVEEDVFGRGNTTIKINGSWNGSEYVGGVELGCEVGMPVTASYSNNMTRRPCHGGDGTSPRIVRGKPDASVTIPRDLLDWMLQEWKDQNYYTSIYLKKTLPITIDGIYYPELTIIIPKAGITAASYTDSNDILVETAVFSAMSDGTYPEFIAILQCAVPAVLVPEGAPGA